MRTSLLAGAVLGAMLAAGSVQAAELIANGGFETGDFSGWTQGGNLGATFVSDSPNAPHSGSFAAQLGPVGSDGTLAQSFSATGSDSYAFSFWHVYAPSAGPIGDFSVALDDTVLYSQPSTSPPDPQDWTQYSFALMPDAGLHTITFSFRQDPSYQGLDDVSLVGPGGTGVPEPATLALLGLGFAGLAHLRRKRA